MTDTFMTYALWGTGDITPENATALLDEYIPENVGTIYRPERITRDQKGLRTALDWFESPDFLGEGGAVPSTDLVQSLTFDRDTQGDEVYLLALWPEVPGHEDFDFIESVQANGITVLDLARALDELDLSLYSRPEPTKEEKAEARAEAREAAKTAKAPRTTKKLSDEKPDVVTMGVTEPTVLATPSAPRQGPAYVEFLLKEESALWRRVEEAKAAFDQAMKEYMETVTVSMIPVREGLEAAEDEARPPFDGPYVGEGTTDYFYSKTQDAYRLAAGAKPRRGEIVVRLTPEQAQEKGL